MRKEELEIELLKYLLNEINQLDYINYIDDTNKFILIRSLLNKRAPSSISKEFIKVQDEYLSLLLNERGTINYKDYKEITKSIYLIKGDITLLNTDCIVNAANSALLGCFYPNHNLLIMLFILLVVFS